MAKKMTGAEIMEQDQKDFEADVNAMMEEAAPKTPLEAAIDRATGFKPEDMVKSATLKKQEAAETETEEADPETEKPETGTEKPETETKKRDYVEEAVRCFIKDAGDIDPTDPVKAIEAYFRKNATDELKARCKAEGKDAKGCWKFIEAVARKALGNRAGHIDPSAIYAIAMHWFEDVPADWENRGKAATPARTPERKTQKKAKPKKPAETPSEIRKETERKAKAKAKPKAKKPKQQQGFFFEMLETPEQESEVKE